MAMESGVSPIGIVLPAPIPAVPPAYLRGGLGPFPRPPLQQWAPAWFYSALNWLGKPYQDASNITQRFNLHMVGSDVDPYQGLGSTRLFLVFSEGDAFRLTFAADGNSVASTSGGKSYPNTDGGIRQMYLDLSASPAFASATHCYIPAQLGPELNPFPDEFAFVAESATLESGYDPTTGLRIVVQASAVSQVVPLTDFINTHNEQIYNDAPAIVPFVPAMVYDLTEYNVLGAKAFNLPVFYTPN